MITPFWQFWPLRPNLIAKSRSILNSAPETFLETLVGVLFLGVAPPQIPTFSGSDSKRLERGPQHSARRRNFQRSPRTFVVLRLSHNPSQWCLILIPAVTHPKSQKVPFLPDLAPFSTKWLGPRGFQDEASFRRLIIQSRRRTENIRGDFWKFCLWAEK